MITGQVNHALEAIIPLQLVTSDGDFHDCSVLLDTGFDGELLLPIRLIQPLGWRQRGRRTAVLADGTRTTFAVYRGTIRWNGVDRPTQVLESPGEAIIGMRLPKGSRLTIDVIEDGDVSLTPLLE